MRQRLDRRCALHLHSSGLHQGPGANGATFGPQLEYEGSLAFQENRLRQGIVAFRKGENIHPWKLPHGSNTRTRDGTERTTVWDLVKREKL